MFRLRWVRTQVLIALASIFVIAMAFVASYFLYIKQMKSSFQNELDLANQTIEENSKKLYLAKEKILYGESLSKEKVRLEEVFTSLAEGYYISEKDIGKAVLVDVDKGMPILKTMVASSELDSHLREEEFNIISLNSNLVENDYVDIRIFFPNGENYIVLSKKAIKGLLLEENNCFLYLNEEEILKISSAIIDSLLFEGTSLYTVKYIEPTLQKASQTTYLPNPIITKLINSSPNIAREILDIQASGDGEIKVALRKKLETRLDEFKLENKGRAEDPPGEDSQNKDYEEEIYFYEE